MGNVLANIFGASPVMPLEKHIEIAHRCARKLRPFFSAAVSGDWEKAQEVRNEIEALEQEADDLKKKIRLNLPKSLFMPVPREDLLELLLVLYAATQDPESASSSKCSCRYKLRA